MKSRITNLWWLENELRALDLRAQKIYCSYRCPTSCIESNRLAGWLLRPVLNHAAQLSSSNQLVAIAAVRSEMLLRMKPNSR